jgi:hypothetical protein
MITVLISLLGIWADDYHTLHSPIMLDRSSLGPVTPRYTSTTYTGSIGATSAVVARPDFVVRNPVAERKLEDAPGGDNDLNYQNDDIYNDQTTESPTDEFIDDGSVFPSPAPSNAVDDDEQGNGNNSSTPQGNNNQDDGDQGNGGNANDLDDGNAATGDSSTPESTGTGGGASSNTATSTDSDDDSGPKSGSNFGWVLLAVLITIGGCCACNYTTWNKRREQQRLTYRSAQADRVLGDMQMVPNIDIDNELL